MFVVLLFIMVLVVTGSTTSPTSTTIPPELFLPPPTLGLTPAAYSHLLHYPGLELLAPGPRPLGSPVRPASTDTSEAEDHPASPSSVTSRSSPTVRSAFQQVRPPVTRNSPDIVVTSSPSPPAQPTVSPPPGKVLPKQTTQQTKTSVWRPY